MPIRVLVVDDSSFYRARIEKVLKSDPETEVVGTAASGAQAVEMVRQLKPDVVTMDYEMPGMDGIEAIEKIFQFRPTPILMLSVASFEGAQTTLRALEAGAADFMPKTPESLSSAKGKDELIEKIKGIFNHHGGNYRRKKQVNVTHKPEVLIVGASTGGPVAVQKVLATLPADFSIPILVVIHMPATFTHAFAERLNQRCFLEVVLAETKTLMRPGFVYVAPGGMQTIIDDKRGTLRVRPGLDSELYNPSVDTTLLSAAEHFENKAMAIILTGMGADGKKGALALKRHEACVWVQDSNSCVVYGMPQAVLSAGAAKEQIELGKMSDRLIEDFYYGRG